MAPHVTFGWSDDRPESPVVAQSLSLLAPILAPPNPVASRRSRRSKIIAIPQMRGKQPRERGWRQQGEPAPRGGILCVLAGWCRFPDAGPPAASSAGRGDVQVPLRVGLSRAHCSCLTGACVLP